MKVALNLSNICFLVYSSLFLTCVYSSDRNNKAIEDKLKVVIPPIQTNKVNRYMCYSKSLEELGERYVTSLLTEPNEDVSPHHVDSGLCLEPLYKDQSWECVRGEACKGDAIELSVTDSFNSVKTPFYKLPSGVGSRINHGKEKHYLIVQVHLYEPLKEPTSPANITLTYTKTLPKLFYQKYMLSNSGVVPGNKSAGHLSYSACEWWRPEVFAFDYYVHTHSHGYFVEGFLIRNQTWIYLGGQRTQERRRIEFPVLNGPVKIMPGDILAARCLFINNGNKDIKFGSGENCIFELSIGYDPKHHNHFTRPPVCKTPSPDFTFCSHDKTKGLCDV